MKDLLKLDMNKNIIFEKSIKLNQYKMMKFKISLLRLSA